MCNARIDADYREPAGGFVPVQVTYVWDEGGVERKDVHVANKPEETYAITCDSTPLMKSLIVELIPCRAARVAIDSADDSARAMESDDLVVAPVGRA